MFTLAELDNVIPLVRRRAKVSGARIYRRCIDVGPRIAD